MQKSTSAVAASIMSIKRVLIRGVTIAVMSTALTFGLGAGIARASDPPGACEYYEEGEVKLGPDGYLYRCELVIDDYQCYFYWIPQ